MRVYLPLTPITHTHMQTEVFTHWLVPPPALSWPNVDLFTWPPRDLLKSEVNLVRLSLQCAIALLERWSPCTHYCFPINSTWLKEKDCLLDWKCLLHVPISNFSHESSVPHDSECMPSYFLWNNWESEPGWEREGGEFTPFSLSLFLPGRLKCRASYAEEETMRVWGGCVACETCIHCSVVELNRARKALQAWETEADKERREWERFKGKERRSFQLTMEFSLPF